jgi:hypothetical protein
MKDLQDIICKHMKSALMDFELKITNELHNNRDRLDSRSFDVEIRMDTIEKSLESINVTLIDLNKSSNNQPPQSSTPTTHDTTECQEMYSRRNNIRVYGIEESTGEDTTSLFLNMARKKLGINFLSDRDICRSHRLGRPQPDQRPRPIIVKLLRHSDKESLIKARRSLAGTGIVMREDLTRERMGWIKSLRDIGVDHKSINSNDGVITVYITKSKKYFIHSPSDLNMVLGILRAGAV